MCLHVPPSWPEVHTVFFFFSSVSSSIKSIKTKEEVMSTSDLQAKGTGDHLDLRLASKVWCRQSVGLNPESVGSDASPGRQCPN